MRRRPTRFGEDVIKKPDEALSKSPEDFGIPRAKGDGVVFVEYLKKACHIMIHVRHTRRLIRKMRYSLKRPMYRFVQAKQEGVEEFLGGSQPWIVWDHEVDQRQYRLTHDKKWIYSP
jgi:hypothetical protein